MHGFDGLIHGEAYIRGGGAYIRTTFIFWCILVIILIVPVNYSTVNEKKCKHTVYNT